MKKFIAIIILVTLLCQSMPIFAIVEQNDNKSANPIYDMSVVNKQMANTTLTITDEKYNAAREKSLAEMRNPHKKVVAVGDWGTNPNGNQIGKAYDEIDISEFNMPYDDLSVLFFDIFNNETDIFYMVHFAIPFMSDDGSKVIKYKIIYQFTSTELDVMIPEFDSTVNEIMKIVKPTMSDLEKALVLNNYLVETVTYSDADNLNMYNSYGILVNRKGVCQGYAFAYNCLLKRAGIKAAYVESTPMGHGWSYVEIDGEWYHVDPTWNDPVSIPKGTGFRELRDDTDFRNGSYHTYFLKSDNKFTSNVNQYAHNGWSPVKYHLTGVTATSTKYDDFWLNNINTQMHYRNGYWYYGEEANGTLTLVKSKIDQTDKSTIGTAVCDAASTPFTPLMYFANNRCYYVDGDKIMSARLDGTDKSIVTDFVSNGQINYIEEFYVDKDILYYTQVNGANFEKKEIKLNHSFVLGDINKDKKVDIVDVKTILENLFTDIAPNWETKDTADIDEDDVITLTDGLQALKIATGIVV